MTSLLEEAIDADVFARLRLIDSISYTLTATKLDLSKFNIF